MTTDNNKETENFEPWKNKPGKPNPYIGLHFIKRNTKDGVIKEVYENNPNEKDPANSWKLISVKTEPEYKPLRWVDTIQEYLAIPEEERKGVHIKSKPSTGPYFIGPKGDICFRMYDEYDHATTVRMDNPNNLNAEEATKMMKSLTDDIKKEKEKEKEKKDE